MGKAKQTYAHRVGTLDEEYTMFCKLCFQAFRMFRHKALSDLHFNYIACLKIRNEFKVTGKIGAREISKETSIHIKVNEAGLPNLL